ncbi:DNA-3-methyladenine glycosylase I [Shewanella sp. NIFS-20-20]|uniref:DNA-3-methyladenine glycosylase I n=1 Tax=Shewanella sp. NIFS-20-20 TaxID=2853806 RepID=UPI001C43E47A|nr:DNA-3-methyladenine glycosylase I [Shewanella sp. NIFS-20-20]MBV7315581.1 DNA-3-methyladenine glycosylase I [Shewanella sp. NIFS-20-20]
MTKNYQTCPWVSNDPLYQQYHDHVWGRAVYDDRELFAKLCLDGQQAGLSWLTILKKQAGYEELFFDFWPDKIATLTAEDVERLLLDPKIVRNRAKVNSIIGNAKAYLAFTKNGEHSFSEFLWSFVGGQPLINQFETLAEVPAQTRESQAMSKALKALGFNFVGPTICYAFMQAVGMVNDHLINCPCYFDCCPKK